MKNVFISYADADKRKVRYISNKLKRTKIYKPIVVADNRKSLVALTDKVMEGLNISDIFIPILTKQSFHEQWINQEIGCFYANQAKRKNVFPIVETDILNDLKGFIHNQVDLPYTYQTSIDSKIEFNNFKKCFCLLFEDINLTNSSLTTNNNHKSEYISDNSFRIISPKETEVHEEWAYISGVGAPPKYRILLFTWLKNKFLSLQDDIATADSNGNWYNQKCHLANLDSYREIYTIAIDPDKIELAISLFNEFGRRINPISFQKILNQNNVKNILSAGKKLIRIGNKLS